MLEFLRQHYIVICFAIQAVLDLIFWLALCGEGSSHAALWNASGQKSRIEWDLAETCRLLQVRIEKLEQKSDNSIPGLTPINMKSAMEDALAMCVKIVEEEGKK